MTALALAAFWLTLALTVGLSTAAVIHRADLREVPAEN